MTPHRFGTYHAHRVTTASIALVFCLALVVLDAQQQTVSVGANVNVISGTGPDGDWTAQRQDEPTIACSSRNPQNCIAGANDYRTVDIPFPPSGEQITGDAWLGWYTTKDGGLSWRTRLLPGFPQDTSAVGLASPLKGYGAGADPVIRPGTNGMFYYAGLVFDRNEALGSAIFVARFIDNNNQAGIDGEPIAYLGASIVHRLGAAPVAASRLKPGEKPDRVARANAEYEKERERERQKEDERERERIDRGGQPHRRVVAGAAQGDEQMVDKPWVAVDIPRAGAQMCTIGGPGTGVPLQTFPGGRIYLAYALFDGPNEARGRIMFSRSLDCGTAWTPPRVLSRVQSADVNDDGVATTADVTKLQASLNRSCGQPEYNPNADVNNDCIVNSLDMAFVGSRVGRPVPKQPLLSQGATVAIDPATGALQIAWRQFNDGALPDAIVAVRSNDGGASFSPPMTVALTNPFDQGTTTTSFRTNAFPTLAFDGSSRAYLAWSSRGFATQSPDPKTGDARVVMSTSVNGTAWSAPAAVDNQTGPGHQIMPALGFSQGKLQLVYYDLREDESQLFQQFIDELPILTGQVQPAVRHTIDVRGAIADPLPPGGANAQPPPVFSSFDLSQYALGGGPGSKTIEQLEFNPPNLPIFKAGTSPFMGDYLDTASSVPFVMNGSSWSFNTAPADGGVSHAIWTDNRDVRPPANGDWTAYTPPNPPFARPPMSGFDPSQSIPVCVPGQAGMRNQNIYTTRITQGLVVGALTNSLPLDSIQRSFPVFVQNNGTGTRTYRLAITSQPPGGRASFKQFDLLTTLDVSVPARSTIARTVFAQSSDRHAPITVTVTQITAPNGGPVANGQRGTIVLNPDPTNPEIENPEIENPEIENPEIENSEVHNPEIENATARNPEIENPEIENPEIENPEIENVRVANPDILNPEIENPEIENPEIENPEIENPEIENADLLNGALSDTTWVVKNDGNTAAAYTIRLALTQQLPEGFKSQLIAHKVYQTPTILGCDLLKQPQTVLLANVPSPRFVAPSELANPEIENPEIENVTIALAPGETARITLRVFDPNRFDTITFRAAESVAPAVVAQAVNTAEAEQGITQPQAAGVLTTDEPVPGSTVGGTYTTSLSSIGTGTWTIVGGALPPGLNLDSATGDITGTPTTTGSFTFTLKFQADSGLTDYRTMTITIGAVGQSADLAVSGVTSSEPIALGGNVIYSLRVANAGPIVATNVTLTDTLPEGTTFVSVTPSQGTCQQGNGSLSCSLGTLAAGAFATVQLTVHPTVNGSHTNEAHVTSDQADPATSNNAAQTVASTVSSGAACANPCFSGPTMVPVSANDAGLHIEKGDFNEDGRVDLVFSPTTESTIALLLGDGAGGFAAPTTLTTLDVPGVIVVGDFNNDGHADIVSVPQAGTRGSLFLGNGTGQFGAAIPIAIGGPKLHASAADFNHDGKLDLVAGALNSTTQLVVLNGHGDGTFDAARGFAVGAGPHGLIVDDFNNDGNPDVASANNGAGTLSILLGDGNGGFAITTTAVPTITRVRKVGDLNGDGFSDLVVADAPTGARRQRVFFGDGNGGFAAPVDLNVAPTTVFTAAADLDADGDLDLVETQTEPGGIHVQLNDGTGTFSPPTIWPAPAGSSMVIADLNGDQKPDIAFLAYSAGSIGVLLNTCAAAAADLEVTQTGPTSATEGDVVTWSLTVRNNGPNAASSVQVTDSANTVLTAATSSQGACTLLTGRTALTCQVGTLASGATVDIQVTGVVIAGGTTRNLAGVTSASGDPNPANNSSLVQTNSIAIASTLVVTNTNNTGPGSLSEAIRIANSDGGPPDIITFNIPGAGVHTISPTALTVLPNVNQPVVIDGTTQPGYAGTPLIEISGANAGSASGFFLSGSGSTIRGLAINRWQQSAIFVQTTSSGNTFEANFIGTDAAGTAALPNGNGIFIQGPNNVVGGSTTAARNVISGNTFAGVFLQAASASGNTISGNYIGTDASGATALPNGGGGITVRSAGNTIGGPFSTAGNLISGNTGDGIDLLSGATGNAVQGNRIGTNAAGTQALGNTFQAVFISGGASNNTIGGTSANVRNVLSGNGVNGVFLDGATTTLNTVIGNFIGTDITGTVAIGNLFDGVGILNGAQNNTIGGAAAGAGNLISGNRNGVLFGAGVTGNTVIGNRIGTDVNGTQPLPNLVHGVTANSVTGTNTIGGDAAGQPNTIAFNGQAGVRVDSGTLFILGNSIFSNTQLGIDLAPTGVTANDSGDADAGPNGLQNFPVLTSATTTGSSLTISGTLNTTPNTAGSIRYFVSPTCDSSGNGEGMTFLGPTSGSSDSSGNVVINLTVPLSIPVGQFVTATATNASAGTSEFSACVPVTSGGGGGGTADLQVTQTDHPDPVVVNTPLTYTVTVKNNGPSTANVIMDDVLPAGVTFGSATGGGSCSQDAGTVHCNLNALASGDSVVFTIVVTPTTTNPLTNQATASSFTADPIPLNNSSLETTLVSAFASCTAATFKLGNGYNVGQASQGFIATGDLNHDGKPDVVVSGGNGSTAVVVLLNAGTGDFTDPVPYNLGAQTRTPVIADFDGDGNADIAVALGATGVNGVAFLRGDGAGGFTQVTPTGFGGLTAMWFAGSALLNGDSRPDLVLGATSGGDNVTVLLNQSTPGSFTFVAASLPTAGPVPSAVLADFDGDNDIDIAAGVDGADTLSIYLNDGTGVFSTSTPVPAAPGTFSAPVRRVRVVGDLNGDGRVDLGVTLSDASFQVLLRNPAGGFDAPVVITPANAAFANFLPNTTFATGWERAADFNGDGHADLARIVFAPGSTTTPVTEILLGDGTGTNFTFSTRLFVGPVQDKFAIDDFDGDGRPDLAILRLDSPTFVVLLNNCGAATRADLEVQLQGPPSLANGANGTYVATVTNHGPDLADNSFVAVALPPGMTPLGATVDVGGCDIEGDGTLTCGLGAFQSGATRTMTVNARAVASGNRVVFAEVFSDAADDDATNNTATVQTTVGAGAVTVIVTNTNSSGPGSLRQAIIDSNTNAGAADTITFQIPGSGVQTITLQANLPTITEPVTIDGTTQPGWSGTPIVEINGNTLFQGFTITGGGTTIRGLVMNRMGGGALTPAININGGAGPVFTGGNVIEGNYFGIDPTGTQPRTQPRAITITNSPNNRIGGTTGAARNVISGSTQGGVTIQGAGSTGNAVQGNYIGLNAAGTAAVPNMPSGVAVQGATGNTIGGSVSGAGNAISGNGSFGVLLSGVGTSGNVVRGNLMGLNAAGTAAVANGAYGVLINNAASSNVVGGPTTADRNVISGNGLSGVAISLSGTTGNTLQGNFIGTNPAGSAALGNATNGVFLFGTASSNTIVGNVISGNGQIGIHISDNGSSNNIVSGNLIGTDVSGQAAIPNATGLTVDSGASNNTIGGTSAGAGNTIANNGVGVALTNSGTGNGILGNSIFSNTGLGIDLGIVGVTPNDSGDSDAGPNNQQNFPVLTAAAGGVTGTLNSAAGTTFRVELFSNTTCDSSGNGEGQRFLGFVSVTTDGSGNGSFPLFLTPGGGFITATATDPTNNTSEFSACVSVAATARTWISNQSGNWEDAANWSGGVVPQPGDSVVINTPNTIAVSVHSAVVTLNSLQSDELISMSGGALTFNGQAKFNGGLTMAGGLIDGPGAIVLGGDSHWTGGQITGGGTFAVVGSLQVSRSGQPGVLARTITNFGFLAWDLSSLQLTNGATIVNEDGAEMVFLSNLSITNGSGVPLALTNHGNMTKLGGGALALTDVAFVSDGDIHLDMGPTPGAITSNLGGTLIGSAALDVGLDPGFVPAVGSTFDVLSFGTLTGTFAAIQGNGQTYSTTYTPTGLRLTTVSVGAADLSLTMTESADPVQVGDQLTYTLTAINHGPDFTDMLVFNTLPQGVTLVSATPSNGECFLLSTLICDFEGTPSGVTRTATIVVTVNNPGVITNSAYVAGGSADANFANNTASVSTTVTGSGGGGTTRTWVSSTSGNWEDAANWSGGIVPQNGDSVVIDVPTAIVVSIQSAVVTLASLQSAEQITMSGGSLTFDGPAQFTGGFVMNSGALGGAGTISLGGGSGWAGGTIGGTGGLTVLPNAVFLAGLLGNEAGALSRSITNHGVISWSQASLSLSNGASITNAADGTIGFGTNLAVSNATPAVPAAITNLGTMVKTGPANGGDLTLQNVSFTNASSGQLVLRLGATPDRIVSNAAVSVAGLLTLSLQSGFVPAEDSTYTIISAGSLTGTFPFIDGGGLQFSPVYTPTSLTVTSESVIADLGVLVVDSPDPVALGGTLTYTVTAHNAGPGAAEAVTVTDQLPADVSLISATPSQGSCNSTPTGGITFVTCSVGSLASGATATITIQAAVSPTAGATFTNFAVIGGTTFDGNSQNNQSQITTTTTAGEAAVFTVTTTSDNGAGSLRQAILDANAHVNAAVPDQVRFAISGTGPFAIVPTSPLPIITDPVIIDATTQLGFAGSPIIEINGTLAGGSTDGLFVTAGNSTIRGFAINGFGQGGGGPGGPGGAGIVIQGAGGNVIEGNFVGTDTTGTIPRSNRSDGIFLDNSPNNRVGGTTAGARNVLSGNGRWGIVLSGAATTGTLVQGNVIGTGFSGVLPVPNGAGGIFVEGSGTAIGGAAGANTIAFNGGPGVVLAQGSAHRVSGNSIHSNAGLGIDLGNNGITANDAGDADAGVNGLQNFPVLTVQGSAVDISLNSAPSSAFTIELFASPSCHPLGNGEGKFFIGSLPLTTNAAGDAAFPGFPAPSGVFLTATATNAAGSTSEFSACVQIPGANHPPVANAGPDQTVATGATVTLDGTASSDVDNDPLTYLWILNTRPIGSSATIVGATTASPTFVADLAGTYVLQLLVNDGLVNSPSDIVSISTQNGTPIANAGPDQSNIAIGATVNLNGSGSLDPDGTPLTYAWTLVLKPAGSGALLVNPTTATPSFVVDAPGRYRAQLVVNDGLIASAADTVDVTTVNQAPTANAGSDRSVAEDTTVQLSGGGSSDPDGNALTFAWSFVSRPNGSTATLTNPTTVTPSFVADLPGDYVIRLVVNDSIVDSAPDDITVTATPNTLSLALVGTPLLGVGRQTPVRVTLPNAAPPAGVLVTVTSDDTNLVTVAAPGSFTIPFGSTTGQILLTGVSVGSTTIRASASGIAPGTLGVSVTQNVISTPALLNVALGQTTALPISIGPSVAPPGGLVLDVASANAGIIEVITPQVTVPQGALSVNATVRGASAGAAAVTVSRTGYASSTTTVTSAANLNILSTSISFNQSLTAPTVTVQLESDGAGVAAPNDLIVTLSSANTACVAVPATVTIPAGQVSAFFQPTYGGTATTPCTTTVTASAPSIVSDSFSVTVTPSPGISISGTQTLGAGLQSNEGATLGASNHGGVTVTVTSSNPARVLVAPSGGVAGSASFSFNVPNGQTSIPYTLQAPENLTGSATVTISAPGFTTASQTVNVVPAGIEIISLPATTTSLSADTTGWYVQVGIPNASNTGLSTVQNVRTGGPAFVFTLTNSNATAAQLKSDEPAATGQTVTKPIQPQFYYPQVVPGGIGSYGLAFDPIGVGSTTVTVTGPPGVVTMTTNGIRAVNVTGQGITIGGTQALAAGLQSSETATLGASQHGGVTVTVTSSDPTKVLVAPNASSAGSASFTLPLANGQTSIPYMLQAPENLTGSATVTISAPGFTSASQTVNVVAPGIEIISLTTSTTTLSADTIGWYVQVGIPNANNTGLSTVQNVRTGGPAFVFTLTNSNASAAQLKSDEPAATGQTVTKPIQPQFYYPQGVPGGIGSYGLAFDPIGVGSTTVTVTGPPGVITMTTNGVRTVNVTGPGISIGATRTVGAGLESSEVATLGASQHGGVTVTVTSNNPTRVLVAPSGTTAGTTSFTLPLSNGQTSIPYFLQGLEDVTGSATVTISAPGFASASQTVNVVAPGIEIGGLAGSTTSLSADTINWYAQVGIPNANNTGLSTLQNLRAGGPSFVATLANSNAAVGQLKSDQPPATGQTVTKPILPNVYFTQAVPGGIGSYGLAFDPIGNGTTSVTASAPGFITMTTNGVRTVTVTSPTISLAASDTVGTGLQDSVSASLGASQHGGVDATITSSAPSLVLVSPNGTTAGTGSITVHLDNGFTIIPFYVQGVENAGGTAVVSVSAPGFTTATMTVTVAQIGIELASFPTTTTAASADSQGWYVQVGLPNAQHTALSTVQNVRAGGPGFVFTLANSNAAVAQLKSDQPAATGQSVTKPILANFYYPQAVPGGISPYGVAFDPLAVGSTTVTVTGPAGVLTMSTNGVRTVTVTTPGITVNSNNVTIGAGLQKGFYAASLGGSAHGGVTVRIASSDPTIALVSVNASTAGAAFIDVPVANGSTTANYYLQGTAVGSTGDVTITASVTGFTSGSGTLHIVQPALRIENLVTSLAATAQNDEFFVRLGIPNAQNATLADLQELRVGGGNLTVNLTNSNSTAAQLVTQAGGAQTRTVVINAGQNFSPGNVPTGGVALDPLQAGSTTVTASATGFITTTAGAVAVTITP